MRWPQNACRNNSQQESNDTSALAGATLITNVILPLPHDIYSMHFAAAAVLATCAGKVRFPDPNLQTRGGGLGHL